MGGCVERRRPGHSSLRRRWIGPDGENVARASRALAEFGSPNLLEPGPGEILQLGVAPNRIDLPRETGLHFAEVGRNRIEWRYGSASASWIDIDPLIEIKSRIDPPDFEKDVRLLELVRERKQHGP